MTELEKGRLQDHHDPPMATRSDTNANVPETPRTRSDQSDPRPIITVVLTKKQKETPWRRLVEK